jgi:hypothetical protein
LTITNGSSRRVQLLQEPGVGALFYFEATVDTYIRQGDDTVTAGTGDMFVPAGTKIDIRADDGDNNFLAAYGASASGSARINCISSADGNANVFVPNPPTFVGIGDRGFVAAETDLVLTTPAGVQDDDFLLMVIAASCNAFVDISITTPAGWTLLRTDTTASNDISQVKTTQALFYRVASSEPASYTVVTDAGSATTLSGIMVAYRGVDTSAPIIDDEAGTTFASYSDELGPNTDDVTVVLPATQRNSRAVLFVSAEQGYSHSSALPVVADGEDARIVSVGGPVYPNGFDAGANVRFGPAPTLGDDLYLPFLGVHDKEYTHANQIETLSYDIVSTMDANGFFFSYYALAAVAQLVLLKSAGGGDA